MAIIRVEEHYCDFCGKPIPLEEVHIGKLSVRKRGARGLARETTLSMHEGCVPTVKTPTSRDRANGAVRRRSRAVAKA
jgi:hypothetical protein